MKTNGLRATIMPGITVNDIQKSIKFYVDGLGFEIGDKNEKDGKLTYVGLKAGDASMGLSQDDFAKGRDRVKGVGVRLWFSTKDDIKAIAARAKAAGVKLDGEAAPLPWGPMGFAATDPDGYKITVANDA